MSWRIRNSIGLRVQTGLQLWRTLSDDEDISRAWEHIKQNIKTSAKESLGLHELKQNKPRFGEEYLRIFYQRNQAKIQWIQDPGQSNVNNLNNQGRDASRHFRNKKKAYMKAKIEELETNRKTKTFQGLVYTNYKVMIKHQQN
jgi:hypothetical protein